MNPPLDNDVVVRMQDVSKRYILRKQKPFLMREVFHRLMGSDRKPEAFWALRGCSLEIPRGEAFGIIGPNGAGKSTFLGLVAGTSYPTEGTVEVHGRLGTLLELGAGFHPDLTGRENIYLNASILGLDKEAVDDVFARIVEFSELGDFIDVSLRKYSSGMQVRLGFSVAVHVDPDILIMDEVLAVGDESFQHKCLAKIEEFKARGKTLLFVSHSMGLMRRLCRRAIWLDHGHVKGLGPAEEVAEAYLKTCR